MAALVTWSGGERGGMTSARAPVFLSPQPHTRFVFNGAHGCLYGGAALSVTKGPVTTAAAPASTVRLIAFLLWAGRIIASVWAIPFLLSLIGEQANGYLPGGSAFTSILYFAEGGLMLMGVALSFWRPRVGGMALITLWVASSLALFLGLEPQADVAIALVVGTLTTLLPGLLFVLASIIEPRTTHTAGA